MRPKALWANWYWIFKGPDQNHERLRYGKRHMAFKSTRRGRQRSAEKHFINAQ